MRNIREVEIMVPVDNYKIMYNGKLYYVDADVRVEWGDVGIGPYEFWGQRGVDSREGIVGYMIETMSIYDENESRVNFKIRQAIAEILSKSENYDGYIETCVYDYLKDRE
jgi:hypothetical protein